jgi:hypothetical protein
MDRSQMHVQRRGPVRGVKGQWESGLARHIPWCNRIPEQLELTMAMDIGLLLRS